MNSHLKRAGQDMEKINITMETASEGMCNFAPTLRMDVPLRGKSAAVVPPDPAPSGPPSKPPVGTSNT